MSVYVCLCVHMSVWVWVSVGVDVGVGVCGYGCGCLWVYKRVSVSVLACVWCFVHVVSINTYVGMVLCISYFNVHGLASLCAG